VKYDVIVVGAGPAGSTSAKFLAEEGIKVLLIDKEKFPRDKPCGGGIPIRTLKKFKYIEEKELIESYTYGVYVNFPFKEEPIKVEIEKPMHGMVLRKKFDYGLVNHAIDCGTKFADKTKIVDMKIDKNKVKLITNNNQYLESKIVIGADGVWSIIAKKSNLSQNSKNFGVCLYQEVNLKEKTIKNYFPGKKLAHVHINYTGKNGYGWVFPKREHINIGVGELKKHRTQDVKGIGLKDAFKRYIKNLKENKIIPKEIKFEKVKGAALPSCHIEKTYSDRLLLCGEAAGFINIGGGGIDYAMISGELAAKVTVESLENNRATENYLSRYQRLWMDEFGKDIKIFSKMQKKFGEKTHKFITLACKDEKLSKLFLDVFIGNTKFYENKWKIGRRLVYLYLRDFLHKD